MNVLIKEQYDHLIELPSKIFGIFSDYFGEDRVDLQNLPDIKDFIANPDQTGKICTILIHFPHVRITNEYDNFVDVNHLWVKVPISLDGKIAGKFTIGRSEYKLTHLFAGYMHSHCPGLPPAFSAFLEPCLGTGPILNTTGTLYERYDEAMWKLFCLELDRFMGIESLMGTPYRRLDSIGKNQFTTSVSEFTMIPYTYNLPYRDLLDKFIIYLIDNGILKFNFIGGSYGLAMSYVKYLILVSNKFIEWCNSQIKNHAIDVSYRDLINERILKEAIISSNKAYFSPSSSAAPYYASKGAYVCTFKGDDICLHIIDDTDIPGKVLLLNVVIAEIIAEVVLKVLNYRYGRDTQIHTDSTSPDDQEQAVYI